MCNAPASVNNVWWNFFSATLFGVCICKYSIWRAGRPLPLHPQKEQRTLCRHAQNRGVVLSGELGFGLWVPPWILIFQGHRMDLDQIWILGILSPGWLFCHCSYWALFGMLGLQGWLCQMASAWPSISRVLQQNITLYWDDLCYSLQSSVVLMFW